MGRMAVSTLLGLGKATGTSGGAQVKTEPGGKVGKLKQVGWNGCNACDTIASSISGACRGTMMNEVESGSEWFGD